MIDPPSLSGGMKSDSSAQWPKADIGSKHSFAVSFSPNPSRAKHYGSWYVLLSSRFIVLALFLHQGITSGTWARRLF